MSLDLRYRQSTTPFMVRLPKKLHRRLVQLARSNRRSLNKELVSRLERTVAAEDPLPPEFERLLALRRSGSMTRTEVHHLFGRHRSAEQIGIALTLLLRTGRAK